MCGLLFLAVVNDIQFQKIPNRLTYPAMAAGLALGGFQSGSTGVFVGLAGIGTGIAVLLLPYVMGGMGAGDAKLMGAVGGFVGPRGVLSAFLFSALAGGVYALVLLLVRGSLRASLERYGAMLKSFFLTGRVNYLPPAESEERPRLRYGIAIAVGTVLSILWGEEILFAGINGSLM